VNTIERALAKKKKNQAADASDETAPLVEGEGTSENEQASLAESQKAEVTGQHKSTSEDTVAEPESKAVAGKPGSLLSLEIDLASLEANGYVSLTNSRQLVNEEYRAIKRKVLNNAFGPLSSTLENSNVIMVSSPRPNDGKTFTAINLALSIALEQDKTVLLVDADVLRPSVMRELGVNFDKGLMEYLLGDVTSLSEVMYSTNVEKLKVIPAGKSHHLSTELLASEKMWETVQEFSRRYADRVVIFDTPPLLGINETAILANLAGQAVVVIKENSSKISDVNEAIKQLNPEMSKGFVVNQSTQSGEGAGYYGYYYSGNAEK
jgi:receptor protein-tyrosine kinase